MYNSVSYMMGCVCALSDCDFPALAHMGLCDTANNNYSKSKVRLLRQEAAANLLRTLEDKIDAAGASKEKKFHFLS